MKNMAISSQPHVRSFLALMEPISLWMIYTRTLIGMRRRRAAANLRLPSSDVSARISFQEHRMKEAYLMNIHEILSLLKAFFAEQDPAHRIDHPPLYRCSIRPLY